MTLLRVTPEGVVDAGNSLDPIVEGLQAQRPNQVRVPVERMIALFDDYSRKLLRDPRTRSLEAVMFLSAWLKRDNLQKILELNLNGDPACLDGFVPHGRGFLAAKPHGLVSTWMAGNVGTLPMFSLVPTLLTKNVSVLKLAAGDPEGLDRLLGVLADSSAEGLSGRDLLEAVAVVCVDHTETGLGEAMSLAADVKVMWGGEAAIRGISSLPKREHCVDVVFGPKYSIGVIDRGRLEGDADKLDEVVAAFVRDVAIFDQRACSAPQTIFVERNSGHSLREIGEMFAKHFSDLPPKPGLDAWTTMEITNTRAEWALAEDRDVIASEDGANWTVCMDGDLSLKDAVQSRTVFLTEVESASQVVDLITPKVQTVGIAFADSDSAHAFAEPATEAGAARCVRPGLMNLHESPWDGKLFVNQLVRWVTLKP